MNIAVLFGEIAYISRSRIIDGILDSAKKDGSNVVLFTCEGFLFHELKSYISGEYVIFKLPAFENFDGVIIDLDSIQNKQTQEYLIENINNSNIPCVSFNRELEIANEIYFDNDKGFTRLIEHLTDDHKLKDFYYISGPFGNRDAIERKQIFTDVLKSREIGFPDDRVYEGDFNFGSGREAIKKYVETGKKMPEAFVAANDFMAIGAMEELKKLGYKVPEDVIVTGYDNCEIADYTEPRLTTVDRNEYFAGKLAYEKLVNNIEEIEECGFSIVEGRPILSRSCGCNNCLMDATVDIPAKSNTVVDVKLNMDQSLDLIKGLSIELSEIGSIDSFERSLEKYIEKMGMDYFYFCQCGSRESYYDELETLASGKRVRRNMKTYQDTVWCPIAYEKGEWNSYPKFSTRLLFPPSSKFAKEGTYYIVLPVHQGEICIGYSIIGNFSADLSGRVLQHLILGIDEALGNIRKNDIMTTMLAKINQKWQYDELTGLYNRSGMLNNINKLLDDAHRKKMGLVVIFFDLDGLKAVNDTQGHEAGDKYIKSMADILLSTTQKDDIVVRYGGDEYIVLSKQASWDDSIHYLNNIQEHIVDPVSASAGCVFGHVNSIDELNRLIEEADKKMYEYKKLKKKAR